VGSEVSDIEAISRSYEEADLAMLYRLISGGDRVLAYENVQRSRAAKTSVSFLDWGMLEKTLKDGDTEAVRTKTRKLVSKLCDAKATPEIVQQQICKMLLHFYEMAVHLNIVQEWLDGKDMKHVLEHILSITSKAELAHTCEELLGRLSDRQHQSSGCERPVDKVVRYVNEHFQEPLTLSKMAETVYLNPSYLSTLFKNQIGVTFVDYVNERRIEEAKKLLLTTERKITDIAAVTGFANLRHFNRVFRAATNQTPGEYRGSDSQ
jgi:two-component system response regulator YesN